MNPMTVDDGTEEPSAANMGFRWYDIYINGVLANPGGNQVSRDQIRSAYVRPGCTLTVFENEGFTGRSDVYSAFGNGPAGQFELTEGANNMNVVGIKSLTCHCLGTFCYFIFTFITLLHLLHYYIIIFSVLIFEYLF